VDVAPVSVYFDYDFSELSPETRTVLQSFFEHARQRPDQGVRIEGNCDERGSREYNLALGQRRADAARKYLENLGLDPRRITTISNGKERPRAGTMRLPGGRIVATISFPSRARSGCR